jgi:hypothetical protein
MPKETKVQEKVMQGTEVDINSIYSRGKISGMGKETVEITRERDGGYCIDYPTGACAHFSPRYLVVLICNHR